MLYPGYDIENYKLKLFWEFLKSSWYNTEWCSCKESQTSGYKELQKNVGKKVCACKELQAIPSFLGDFRHSH